MSTENLRTVVNFSPDDQAWLRMSKLNVPDFWSAHGVAPAQGDLLRIAGRQFQVQARVWEHDATGPLLRIFVGDAHAQSDTVFG